jgi:hypothetical protein
MPTVTPVIQRTHPRRSLPTLLLGLYVGRVAAETSTQPWPGWALAIVVVAGLGVGWLVVRLLRALRWDPLPLAILGVYVIWPHTTGALAAGVALAGSVSLVVWNAEGRAGPSPHSSDRGHPSPPSSPRKRGEDGNRQYAAPLHRQGEGQGEGRMGRGGLLEGAVFAGALAVYLATLAPSVLPADAGEFQLVGAVLGIAHPPGYPLYTLLAHTATLLPWGDAAWRVNALSALCGALTLAVVVRGVRRETGSVAAACIAAGALGVGATFWAQSTTANIRSLTALFTALCVTLLLRWGHTRRWRGLALAAAAFGLGVGHHSSLGLLALPFLAYVVVTDPRLIRRPREWLPAAGALGATFLVLLYLPLRSAMGTPFDPAPIRTIDDFLEHVLATGFRGDMLYYRTVTDLVARGRVGAQILRLQFGPIVLTAAGAAVVRLAVHPPCGHHRRALLLLGGAWLVNVLAALTYRAPQTVEYLIPSYVALALLLGLGLGMAPSGTRARALRAGVVGVLAVAVATTGARNLPSMRALSADHTTRDGAAGLLEAAPEGALILADWHHATPLWYLQRVEGLRPDVAVEYVYPEGATPNEAVWLRRIDEAIDRRPVLVTNRFLAFAHTDYRWIPFQGARLVAEGQGSPSLADLPEGVTPREVPFGDELALLGYRLAADTVAPGGTVELEVHWRVLRSPTHDYTAFAQLLGPQGVVGQGDLPHPTTRYLPGEVRVDAYRFPLLLHTPPGEYRLITGFYHATDNGWTRLPAPEADHAALATITVLPADAPPATRHPLDHAFAGGLRLVGVDYDASVPGQGRVYLHWQRDGLAPLDRGPWRASSEAATVRAVRNGQAVAQAALPALQPGDGATVALDLPFADGKALRIEAARADGTALPALGAWHRAAGGVRGRAPAEGEHYVPLGGAMAFIGLADPPPMARPGSAAWLRPRFLALRPLALDASVSVGLARPDLGWEHKVDGTPALGAIPTLKWVRGWLVEDAHALSLPTEAPSGPAEITVAVYDAFTLAPLHVLDERLAREGQGIQFRAGTLEVAP